MGAVLLSASNCLLVLYMAPRRLASRRHLGDGSPTCLWTRVGRRCTTWSPTFTLRRRSTSSRSSSASRTPSRLSPPGRVPDPSRSFPRRCGARRVALLRLQLRLGLNPLQLRDVMPHAHHPDEVPRSVPPARGIQKHIEALPILRHQRELEVRGLLPPACIHQDCANPIPLSGSYEIVHKRDAHGFLHGKPGERRCLLLR